MHRFTYHKRNLLSQFLSLLFASAILLILAGCGGSAGLTKQEVEAIQQQQATNAATIDRLQTENTGLKQKLSLIEQEKIQLSSRLANLQSQYNAEREKAERAAAATKTETRSVPITPPAAAGSYDDGKKAFSTKKYDDAIAILGSLLKRAASDEEADNYLYWLGEGYFGKKSFSDAIGYFERVVPLKYSEKKADAQYMIGRCLEQMGKKAEAKAAYEKVVKDYPTSDNLEHAKLRWGKL